MLPIDYKWDLANAVLDGSLYGNTVDTFSNKANYYYVVRLLSCVSTTYIPSPPVINGDL